MNVPKDHPMAEMDASSRAAAWYRGLASHPQLAPHWPPKALLVVSAHWEEAAFTVQEAARPPLLFDYHGFPPETYKLTWPAPGAPALAARVKTLLADAGLPTDGDAKRGYDHGVFVPLKLAVPDAGIPTMQLSLHRSLDRAMHLRLGAALAPLRREGVLIVGSGFATHNLQEFFTGTPGGGPVKWARDFDGWLGATMLRSDPEERVRRLVDAEASAPSGSFRRAHPREEHFTPLLVVTGAAVPEAVDAALGPAKGRKGGSAGKQPAAAGAEAAVAADGSTAAPAPVKHESHQIYEQVILGTGLLSSYLLR
jgi:aromatic ring-opening dioxygenase catalytic subunit (LigB family)